MKCPVCHTAILAKHDLGQGLESWKCATCGGQWVNSYHFWKWLEEHPQTHRAATLNAPPDLASGETPGARICPECGHILAKYKVGHSVNFSLDRCGQCGGIWFDKNEWEILESRDLQAQIHLIFSDTWQHRVRNEERARHLEELFAQRVGEKDFAEIKRIREWLEKHPHRQELRGYLDHGGF